MSKGALLGLVMGTMAFVSAGSAHADNRSVTLSTPAPSEEGPGPSHGLSLGVRLGVAVPYGEYQPGSSLSDIYAAAVPIGLDAGYLFSPKLYFGIYYSIAPAFLGGTTRHSADDGSITRVGLNVHYHLMPQRKLDPWVGVGMGYESGNLSSTPFGLHLHQDSNRPAFELLNLQLGADYKFLPELGVGPVVMASLSDYLGPDWVLGDHSHIGTGHTGWHGFLTIGIRGVYDFGF